jgi:hypothetical protein
MAIFLQKGGKSKIFMHFSKKSQIYQSQEICEMFKNV